MIANEEYCSSKELSLSETEWWAEKGHLWVADIQMKSGKETEACKRPMAECIK